MSSKFRAILQFTVRDTILRALLSRPACGERAGETDSQNQPCPLQFTERTMVRKAPHLLARSVPRRQQSPSLCSSAPNCRFFCDDSVSNPRGNSHRTTLPLIMEDDQPPDIALALASSDPLLPKLDDPRSQAGFVPFSPLAMPGPPSPDSPETPPRRSSPPPRPATRLPPPSAPPSRSTDAIPLSSRPAQPVSAAQNGPGC